MPADAVARVLVAVAQPLLRSALSAVLERADGLEVVGTAGSGEEVRVLTSSLQPDLVLLDDELPGELTSADVVLLGSSGRHVPTYLLITSAGDQGHVLAALEAGAIGYVDRDARFDHLLSSIRAALRGEACIPRRMIAPLLRSLIDRRRRDDVVHERYARLSGREKEVLVELVRGRDHQEIARTLFISPQTVRTHIQNLLGKLEVHSRIEAVTLALDHGLVETARRPA